MKKIPVIISALFLFSCSQSKTELKSGFKDLYAIILQKDSTRTFGVVGEEIVIDDSTSAKRNKLTYKTMYGVRTFSYKLDSLGKQIRDSLGNPILNPQPIYTIISKDSILILSHTSVDSLLKKGKF